MTARENNYHVGKKYMNAFVESDYELKEYYNKKFRVSGYNNNRRFRKKLKLLRKSPDDLPW